MYRLSDILCCLQCLRRLLQTGISKATGRNGRSSSPGQITAQKPAHRQCWQTAAIVAGSRQQQHVLRHGHHQEDKSLSGNTANTLSATLVGVLHSYCCQCSSRFQTLTAAFSNQLTSAARRHLLLLLQQIDVCQELLEQWQVLKSLTGDGKCWLLMHNMRC